MSFNIKSARDTLRNISATDRLPPPVRAALTPLLGGNQPQLDYMWQIQVIDPHNAGDNNNRNFNAWARSTAIPASMREVVSRNYAGVEYSYSGKDTSPRIFRMTFFDNQALDTYRYVHNWYKMSSMGDEHIATTPELSRRHIQLWLKDTTDFLVNESFTMTYCFPMEISEAQLTYEGSEVMTFDVMFKFREKVVGV